jgi:hypothetical protein
VNVHERGGTDGRVLYQSLSCYTERLYPDEADLVGRHVLYNIYGGPGRLAEGMLADCRAHGVSLFTGVQNTTLPDGPKEYWPIAALTAFPYFRVCRIPHFRMGWIFLNCWYYRMRKTCDYVFYCCIIHITVVWRTGVPMIVAAKERQDGPECHKYACFVVRSIAMFEV